MLIGEAGARKSTSIKLVKKLLGASGYTDFSANKQQKKFLVDLQREEDFGLVAYHQAKLRCNNCNKFVGR